MAVKNTFAPARTAQVQRFLSRIHSPILLTFTALIFVSACRVEGEETAAPGPAGVYTLVSVDGATVPANVAHGDVNIQVRSGTFTIHADGTCGTRTTFVAPNGAEVTREVTATYTQDGATLKMQWKGAGRTEGTVEGDRFTMNNEGNIFLYRKQSGDDVLDRFVGVWRSVQADVPAGAEGKGVVDLTYKRVLGEKFVQEMGSVSGEETAMILFTYDADQRLYRSWRFAATDPHSEATGHWDAESNTLEMTSPAKEGQEFTMTSKHHFVNENVFEWEAVGTEDSGKELFRVEGTATRVDDPEK